jgi:phosphohistidine swiveling domain-containing protein
MMHSRTYVLPLHQVRCSDEVYVGRKAAYLGELSSFVSVPPGFCITLTGFRTFLEYNNTGLLPMDGLSDQVCNQLREEIMNGQWPPLLRKEILESYRELEGNTVAVRSSGLAEDQPETSFAGQLTTILGVTTETALLDSIKTCWASLFAPHVLAYRRTIDAPGSLWGAVIVQKMVIADFSGVTFTQDPMNNDLLIIEIIAGLGQGLVSGTIHPSRYSYKKKNLHLQNIEHQQQHQKIILARQGIENVPLIRNSTLAKKVLKQIVQKSTQIERHFGCPQDIEWAVEHNSVFFLQTRPIPPRRQDQLWARSFGDDYCSGVMSPLFFSWLTELMSPDYVKQYHGYLFVTTSFLQNLFNIQHLPRFCRRSIIQSNFPIEMYEVLSNLPYTPHRKLLLELAKLFAAPDVLFFTTVHAYKKFEDSYLKSVHQFDAQLVSATSPQQLLDLKSQLDTIFAPHMKLSFAGVLHCLAFTGWLEGFLDRWLHDSSFLYSLLTDTSNRTTETNATIVSLGRQVQENRNLFELFTRDAEYILQHLSEHPSFYRSFQQFLGTYGHRSFTRDPLSPRWSEQPSLVIENIRTLALNPHSVEKKTDSHTQQQAIKHLQELSVLKHVLIQILLSYARKYIDFRENERFILDVQISRIRTLYLAMGQILLENKNLKKKEDVFYLDMQTIRDLLLGKKQDVAQRVDHAKRQYEIYQKTVPPKFLRGDHAFDDIQPNELVLTGTPASSGRVRGKAHVITTINEMSALREKEILITRLIDPGITPYFSTIAGVVTEIGGVLSHGAILSREYHIPAVTGVQGAINKISTGDDIIIDGDTGKIYLTKQ